jgi:hypothetical protein
MTRLIRSELRKLTSVTWFKVIRAVPSRAARRPNPLSF